MKSSRLLRLFPAVLFAVLLPWAMAQQGNQGSGSGTGGSGTSSPSSPKAPRATPTLPQPDTRLPDLQKIPETIFISGSVMQEDGSPPPFGTTIELDCGDTVTREATVDSGGYFGFQIGSGGRAGRVMADASDPFGRDPFDTAAGSTGTTAYDALVTSGKSPLSVRLMRCELRAQYPGFRSTSVRMAPGTIAGYVDVGRIMVYRLERIRGSSVSASSLLAPKQSRKLVERAEKSIRKNKLGEAEQYLTSSLGIFPRNAEALFLLGRVFLLQERKDKARESLLKALEVDRLYVRPYILLARLGLARQDWKNAAELSGKALELDPISYPESYLVNAMACYSLGDMDAAERSARKGQRLDMAHQYPMLHLVLANVLARKKDDAGSLAEMRRYLKVAPNAENASLVRLRVQEKERNLKAGGQNLP